MDVLPIRVMTHLKSSLAPEGHSIAFEMVEDGAFRWIGRYDVTADDLLSGITPVEEKKSEQVQTTLNEILADGPVPCVSIYERFRELGISERTVDAAKRMLNIKSLKRADAWYWEAEKENKKK